MKKPIKHFQGFNITFNTTQDCNLRCKYCYEVSKQKKDLPIEYAQKFIHMILDDDDPVLVRGTKEEFVLKQGLILDFIGGDSLIHPELLDNILEYYIFYSTLIGHRWANRWRVSLSTNGTFLDRKDVRAFIEKYHENLSLGISIDGCPALHDLNRVYPDGRGSMDAILKNWSWYLSVFGNNGRTTKSTLSKQSIPYIYESMMYMYETMGIFNINQNFIYEDMGLESSDLLELEKQIEKCVKYLLDHKDQVYWSFLDENLVDKRIEDGSDRMCGSGMMPALSTDGKIYPCFRFLPHTLEVPSGDEYVAGDIERGWFNKEAFLKVRGATRSKITSDKCKECEFEPHCKWCIGGSVSCGKGLTRLTNICEITKIQVKWARIYWNEYNKTKE